MSILNTQTTSSHDIIRDGLLIGITGGLAEIAVILAYSAIAGGDASNVAREVAAAAGLAGASAMAGVAVHMALALALGIALAFARSIVAARPSRATNVAFMLGALAAVWSVNFFVVLPAISPSFVHLLPYAVTFGSKLAFGMAAAATFIRPRTVCKPRMFGDGHAFVASL